MHPEAQHLTQQFHTRALLWSSSVIIPAFAPFPQGTSLWIYNTAPSSASYFALPDLTMWAFCRKPKSCRRCRHLRHSLATSAQEQLFKTIKSACLKKKKTKISICVQPSSAPLLTKCPDLNFAFPVFLKQVFQISHWRLQQRSFITKGELPPSSQILGCYETRDCQNW